MNNYYQQNSKVLYTFVHNKSFGKLLDISSHPPLPPPPQKKNIYIYIYFLKKHLTQFYYIKVWFTDQSFKPLDIEDKINITLVIN